MATVLKGVAMRSQSLLVYLLLIAALLWRPRTGDAHAFLDHAEPKVGSTVRSPPAAVTLTFTEGVEPAFSRIDVADGQGKALAIGALEHPDAPTLRVSLPALAGGRYQVRWKVVSEDTHETQGSFEFSVAAP
jgi:methionine-rich copper-binding protein CopC